MSRNHVNLILDLLLAAAALVLLATGLLIAFVLPPGSHGATVWGWTRHDFGDLHLWVAVAMVALLLVHVALHWTWVCTMAGRVCGRKARGRLGWRRHLAGAVTVAVVVAAVGGFVLAAADAHQPAAATQHARGGGRHRDAAAASATPPPRESAHSQSADRGPRPAAPDRPRHQRLRRRSDGQAPRASRPGT